MNIEAIRHLGRNSVERARDLVVQASTYAVRLREVFVEQMGKVGNDALQPLKFIQQAHQNFLRTEPVRARWVMLGETVGLLTPPAVCFLGILPGNEAVAFGGFVFTLAELGATALMYQRLLFDRPWAES